MIPIALGTREYKGRSLPVSAMTCVNLYAEIKEGGAKSQIVLHGTPGLLSFATLGAGPVRGMHVAGGILYAVSGGALYKILSDGSASSLGNVSGAGRVSMADNGEQLVIVNSEFGYVYTISNSSFSVITDADFLPTSTATYQDGFFIFPRDGAGTWFISGLLDGSTFNALDFGTTYGNPDDVETCLSDHGEIWVFGKNSIEVFYNSGGADFPFSRIAGGVIERGCAAKYTPTKMDNTVYWLGDDLAVYRARGYVPEQISDATVEFQIQKINNTSDAFGWSYSQEGHKFYVLTFPSGGLTVVYDSATGLWHRRAYSLNGAYGRHRANCYAYAYDTHYVGDYENGHIYQLDLDTYSDDGDLLVAETTTPPVHANGERVVAHRLWVDLEAGVGLNDGQGAEPEIMLSWSDDGKTFVGERWATMGKQGDRGRQANWRKFKSFYQRSFRLRISDPVKRTLIGGYIE